MSKTEKIKLQSTDGETFLVDVELVKPSAMLKEMIDLADSGVGEGEDEEPIKIQNVNSTCMRKLIDWLEYHKNDPIPVANENKEKNSDDISDWDRDFFRQVDQATLVDLTIAARFLQIDGLLETCCKTIANMMKGRTPHQLRVLLNIPQSELEGFSHSNGDAAVNMDFA